MTKRSSRKPREAKIPPTAYEKALDLLARRQQTTAELRRKLRQREYENEEIEAAIERLTDLRYLDDDRTAEDWAAELASRGGMGRRRALEKMIHRGLPVETARKELLAAWDDDRERSNALALARKWVRTRKVSLSEITERRRLARSLATRGFDAETVWRTVAAVSGEMDDSAS
ncbi:MAG: RecX family transcriptional regulator [bacterium]